MSAPSATSTNGGSVSYTVTYSDANIGTGDLTAGGITVNSSGTASAGSVIVAPGSGTSTSTNYTVTLSSLGGAGTLGITVAAGTATDLAGNANPRVRGPPRPFSWTRPSRRWRSARPRWR